MGHTKGALEIVVMSFEPTFWQGRRVFITGHTGFKGGWLASWLIHLGAEVYGFSLSPTTNPSLFEMIGLENSWQVTL